MDHEQLSSSTDEPPQKKQRVLACRRCRSRKQRCEGSRPCANCIKSGDDCVPTEPAPRNHFEVEYVKSLEERVAELEGRDVSQNQDIQTQHEGSIAAENGRGAPTCNTSSRRTERYTHRTNDLPTLNSMRAGYGQGRTNRRMLEAVHSVSGDISAASFNARRSYSHRSPCDTFSSLTGEDSDDDIGHLIYGLVTSPPGRDDGLASNFAKSPNHPASSHRENYSAAQSIIASMAPDVEELLLASYRDRAQAQYPFLHWDTFLDWLEDWKTCPQSEFEARSWKGFFVNLVYSAALLVLSLPRVGTDARTFYKHGISLLPCVLRQSDPILHIQAYLILCVHAIHRSNTPRILSLAPTPIRHCVQAQFHLQETEPEPTTPAIRLQNQIRRRCFWSAYCMDRLIMVSFELPPTLSDTMITAKLYANIDDEDLEAVAARTPPDTELPDSSIYTCVSSALHILQCRRIQSEIIGHTLRWDYRERYEEATDWRVRILNELEIYKSRVQNSSDPQAKGHTSHRWLSIIYHYTLLILYRPTKESVLGPAGDWSIQASSQASLSFRKSQMDRQIAQGWLGLLVQFQSGVTLLYCCWATPPEYRTENYDSPDVSDALRACSNILAIMSDRWPRADCLRDVFELLAREVPLVDRPSRPPTRISEAAATVIREKLPRVRQLVVHRSILRMIEEMISDDFPRLRGNGATGSPLPPVRLVPRKLTPSLIPRRQQQVVSAPPSNGVSFELPFAATQIYGGEDEAPPGLSADELLAFPGMFDLDSWA